ncbi:MAG: hypothetical protein ACRDTE_14590 [Pseudonocardiaceae bacterium]
MTTPTHERLAQKIIDFNATLTELESFNMNLLMSVSVGGIAPYGTMPTGGVRGDAWEAGLRVLSHMHPGGLRYHGPAPILTAELLRGLQAEAEEQEKIAHRTGVQELSPGGPVAVAFSSAPEVLDFVSEAVGHRVFPTEIGSYLFYNQTGDYLYPHVDTEVFAVNLIVMLKHDLPEGTPLDDGSSLLVWEAGNGERRVPLAVGEVAVLLASGTVHGREAIGEGEKVTIVTVGFQYTGVDVEGGE